MVEDIEKNLNVPYWNSKQSFYCSEASAQMFLDYYGYKLSQDYIHQYADRFEDLLPFLTRYASVVELIPSKPLFIDSINQGNPLLLRIHNKYLHTVVVIGYTANDFIIHDPDQRANIHIDQDKLLDISEKIILKREKMSDIEELEKRLVELKRQHDEIVKKETDELAAKKTETGEKCPACKVAVGIGMYLNICKDDLDSEENCMKLYEKVTSEEITPEEFFNIIKEKAKDKPKELDLLECIDELMEEAKRGE